MKTRCACLDKKYAFGRVATVIALDRSIDYPPNQDIIEATLVKGCLIAFNLRLKHLT